MNIGLIAHNSKKKLMQNLCIACTYYGVTNGDKTNAVSA